MYSDSTRESIRNLLRQAAFHYQRAAEEAGDEGEASGYQEGAALLEELIGKVSRTGPAEGAPGGKRPGDAAREPRP